MAKAKSAKSSVKSAQKKKMPRAAKSAPVAYSSTRRTEYGRMKELVVKHSEMVGPVLKSTSFSLIQFTINPGLDTLFKWLAPIAARYEQYKFDSLSFEYRGFTSATTPGIVTLAVDYDVKDAAPTSRQQMSQYSGAVSTNVWNRVDMNCLASDLQNRQKANLFTRVGSYDDTDARVYDMGTAYVATEGSPADEVGQSAGDLWVHYAVRLMIPQVNDTTQSIGFKADSSMFNNSAANFSPRVDQQIMDKLRDGAWMRDYARGILEQGAKDLFNTSSLSPTVLDKAFVFEHEWEGTYETDAIFCCEALLTAGKESDLTWFADVPGPYESPRPWVNVPSMASISPMDRDVPDGVSFGELVVSGDAHITGPARVTWGAPTTLSSVDIDSTLSSVAFRAYHQASFGTCQYLWFNDNHPYPSGTKVGIYFPVHLSVDIQAKAGSSLQLSFNFDNYISYTVDFQAAAFSVHCIPGFSGTTTSAFYPRYPGIASAYEPNEALVAVYRAHSRQNFEERLRKLDLERRARPAPSIRRPGC